MTADDVLPRFEAISGFGTYWESVRLQRFGNFIGLN